ncbi:MAG: hypothetical protein NTZ90_05455 [Proteobacteria bacterium]|nr:hypothetical protein [Pseudomonadota bacterium]
MSQDMPRMFAAICFMGLAWLRQTGVATAATWSINSTGGVLQQPTSHYYHAIYGAEALFATTTEGLLIRASYLERPEFHDAGYADKDYGWFGLIGTKVTKAANHGLFAFIGGGRMSGYVKADSDYRGTSGEASNHYLISGLTVAMAYGVHLGPVYLAAEQQTFVGYVDKVQLDALVGWPFHFFQIKAGLSW